MLKLSKLHTALLASMMIGASGAAWAQADNSNSKVAPATSFSSWMADHSRANQGRIARDVYMQEAGRRWDSMDRDRQGLTTAQINGMYGYQVSSMSTPKDSMTKSAGPTNVTK